MELSSLIDENEAQPSKPTRSQVDADVLTSESRNTKVPRSKEGMLCETLPLGKNGVKWSILMFLMILMYAGFYFSSGEM